MDYLTKANIILDPDEYGGNADPHVEEGDYADSSSNIDKEKGILRVKDGEQWMYFLGDYAGEGKEGSQARQNREVTVEVADGDIAFIQNSIGGYCKHETSEANTELTTVIERGGVYIQNGVVLTKINNRVHTNFPTSVKNNIIFTKIHATNSYYEISPNHFIGKGKLTDTDELPDGRRITKHSFWMPKKFLKEVFEGKWD